MPQQAVHPTANQQGRAESAQYRAAPASSRAPCNSLLRAAPAHQATSIKLFFCGHVILGASTSLPRITIMSSSVRGRLLPFLPVVPLFLAAAGRGGGGGAEARSVAMSTSVNGSSGSLAGWVPLAPLDDAGGCRGGGTQAMQGSRWTQGRRRRAAQELSCDRVCSVLAAPSPSADHSVLPWMAREGAPAAAVLEAPPGAGGGAARGGVLAPVSCAAHAGAVLGAGRAAVAPASCLGDGLGQGLSALSSGHW